MATDPIGVGCEKFDVYGFAYFERDQLGSFDYGRLVAVGGVIWGVVGSASDSSGDGNLFGLPSILKSFFDRPDSEGETENEQEEEIGQDELLAGVE